jgi:DNA-directed RNA polymerase specialized sigma24 family protein
MNPTLAYERERKAMELLSVAGLSNAFISKLTGVPVERVKELRFALHCLQGPLPERRK